MNAEGELCEGQRKGGKSKWGGLSMFFIDIYGNVTMRAIILCN